METKTIDRIAAAIDYMHSEFRLNECPTISAEMWSEAFRNAGSAPDFMDGRIYVGISNSGLYEGPLMEQARIQYAQLTIEQWSSLGL